MAVELPRINRAQPQAPQPSQKLDVNLPNIAEATAPIGRAISNSTEKVVDAFSDQQKKQQQVWDTKTTDVNNVFERALKNRLSEIKLKTGDTTKDFVDYEDFAQKTHDEMMASFNDNDPEFKTLLSEKMLNTFGRMKSFKDDQQYEQHFKYQNETSDARVKLDVDNAFSTGMSLDVKRPDTFTSLDAYIKRIEQTRVSQGDRTGMTVRDEKGVPDYFNGPVGAQIRKDVGDTIVPLVKSLNAAGKVEEGKKVLERYSDYLNAADKSNLMNDNNEADVKNQAITHLYDLQASVAKANPDNKNRRVMIGDIDKLKNIPEAVKFKIIELNDIYNKRQDAEQDRKMEVVISTEYEKLLKRQAGPDAYVSEAEWINSPEAKNIIDQGAKPSEINNLKAVVVAPLKSKQFALDAFNKATADRTLAQMTPRQISEIWPHLSKEDRTRFNEIRRDQLYDSRSKREGGPVGGDKISGMHSRMVGALEKQMKAFRDPSNNELLFAVNSKDKFDDEYDSQMLTDFSSRMREQILQSEGKLTGVQENEIVNKTLNEMVAKRKEDHKSFLSSFFGVDYKPSAKKSVTPSASAYGARNSTVSKTTQSLTPVAPVTSEPNPIPSTVVSPSTGTVTNLPPDTDRKSWIRLWEDAAGKKFDSSKDVESLKTFREELKKKGK